MATQTMEPLRTTTEPAANGAKSAHANAPEPRMADQIIERVIERIGGRAGVESAFGEAITRGELTVVPIAKVRWAFGAGEGTPVGQEDKAMASGSGAGGAVLVDPIGYLEIGPAGTHYKPIVPPFPSPFFLIAGGITAGIVLRAISRLIRR